MMGATRSCQCCENTCVRQMCNREQQNPEYAQSDRPKESEKSKLEQCFQAQDKIAKIGIFMAVMEQWENVGRRDEQQRQADERTVISDRIYKALTEEAIRRRSRQGSVG